MKTAFITGATSGIGKAIARRLAKADFNLIINGRRTERLEELQREIESASPAKVYPLPFDVRVYSRFARRVE